MQFLSWLGLKLDSSRRRTKGGEARRLRRKLLGVKLFVETLEDRNMPSFLGPVNYAVGSYPQAVVTADFNNDAIVDVAVANSSSNTVSVLLGNGNGTFQLARDSATGVYPLALAVGDFNADGRLDLATANANDYGVTVLLGTGDGTFRDPISIGIGTDPRSVAVADFNTDGTLDLGVVSNVTVFDGYDGDGYPIYHDEGYANVLLGNGDGSFSGPTRTWLGYGSHISATVADFNGDTSADFATGIVSLGYGKVSVLLNDGLGNLQPPTDFPAGYYSVYYPLSMAAGNVDGDEDVDLVTANLSSANASVFLGDGTGNFAFPQNYATDVSPDSVVLRDFNNDGNLDITTASYVGNDMSVLLGRGDGTFLPAAKSSGGWSAHAVAAGDFNGDGWLDAATANGPGNNVSVLINDHSWPPVLPSITINDVTVTEGNTGTVNATFTLSLSPAYGQPVTAHYAVANGSATAGSDYTAASGDVTFAAGQTTKTITIAVLGDRSVEPNEYFLVRLTTTDAFMGVGLGRATILDDEPRISISDVTKAEGKNRTTTLFTFTVTLSAAYDQAVTMSFHTLDGTATAGSGDYVARTTGTLTFNPGETTKTITIEVKGDSKTEADETFYLDLFGNSGNSLFTRRRGVGTILNDD